MEGVHDQFVALFARFVAFFGKVLEIPVATTKNIARCKSSSASRLIKLASPDPLFFSPSLCFPMAKCEHCGYRRARRGWCDKCSSIDPFPRRRWIFRGALLFALLSILGVVLFASPLIARQRLLQETHGTTSFRAPR